MAFEDKTYDFNEISMDDLDANPHAIFRAARATVPFIKRKDGAYLILRASDVEKMFIHPETRQVEGDFLRLRGVTSGPLYELFSNSMLFSNGETHRNRRRPLTRQFAFRLMQELRPSVRELSRRLLANHKSDAPLHVRDQFASLLPAHAVASILGIDGSDVEHFTGVVYKVSRSLSHTWTLAELDGLNQAASDLYGYVESLIKSRRSNPREDFLSDFVRAVDASGHLSTVEEVVQIATLIVGGSDTTRAAMVILLSLLLQHPMQLEAVRNSTEALPGAVLEALRYEPPVASVMRYVAGDISLDGRTIPGGSVAVLSLMSAMRDPTCHAEPDIFFVGRENPRWHPVFGEGAHRCLGEALAKIELEEGLSALLEHYPKIRVEGGYPDVRGHAGIRRVGELTISGS